MKEILRIARRKTRLKVRDYYINTRKGRLCSYRNRDQEDIDRLLL